MKIGFIYLPHPYLNQPGAQAPIGLMYLAAVLEAGYIQYEVDIHNFTNLLTYEAIEKLTKADVYGITTTSLELLQANRFAHLIKEKFPNSKVILGGPGTYSEEFVDWNIIDSICVGDGELAILTMLMDIKNNILQKKYIGDPVAHLDMIPFPSRHKLHGAQGGNIFAYNKNYKEGGSTVLVTSRGCPFKCAFCGSPFFTSQNEGIRARSPINIYQEIKQVIEKYNIRQFRISDELFLFDKSRVLKICDLIGPLDIVWRISTRVKPFDYDVVKAMYEAGCKEVSFGIESFDDDVLKMLKKGTTAKMNAEALEIADKVGMAARVLFMIGTPGQTSKTIPTNIKWLEEVPYNIIACTAFTPIPGSEIWACPERFDIEIIDRNLDDYNLCFFGPQGENKLRDVIKLKGRSLEEVRDETVQFREYLKSTNKLNKG